MKSFLNFHLQHVLSGPMGLAALTNVNVIRRTRRSATGAMAPVSVNLVIRATPAGKVGLQSRRGTSGILNYFFKTVY